jgi:hypothetical protein
MTGILFMVSAHSNVRVSVALSTNLGRKGVSECEEEISGFSA